MPENHSNKIKLQKASSDPRARSACGSLVRDELEDYLSEIVDLLRTKTAHDFTHYKRGTLQRRIERRMAMAALRNDEMDRYLSILRANSGELDLLGKDVLINVTRFFRDAKVFDLLAETVIPELIRNQTPGSTIHLAVAGCSTGEEAYSLAMLFSEQIAAAQSDVHFRVLAFDIDTDAIASAEGGFYPRSIEADVSPERLARFFSEENDGYRVSPDIKSSVTFSVRNVLSDPLLGEIDKIDMISCRNLFIYLRPEAQAKAISSFHSILRDGGILLLGGSETIGTFADRFELITKTERVYRHMGTGLPRAKGAHADMPVVVQGQGKAVSRLAAFADLCRRLVIESFAPAAVLINRDHECLYSLGPTDRYLCVAPGLPTHDLLAMARPGVSVKLNMAIQQTREEKARVIVGGGRMVHNGTPHFFSIDVQPVVSGGEDLLFICFVDESRPAQPEEYSSAPGEHSGISELSYELKVTKANLQTAIHNLETSNEEQKTINEEALAVNEEYQLTNEELLASKEELQYLNDELTGLNNQLQETLAQQRTTSNDLQNVLYSTDVATLFLDTRLNIRFFTPATKSLFNVIHSDIGRPLADLNSLAADSALPTDAHAVLLGHPPIEREIEAHNGVWFIRRVLPYRTDDNGVEGVVITFTDITERKRIAKELEAATRQAELANVAKSRFLAAASHDLRQPLQTLVLLQGLLVKTVEDENTQKLVARFDETLAAMSSMLNTLLDINQIEAGTVRADMISFPINDLLNSLRDEFSYHAQAQDLSLCVVPCSLLVHSDPRLLEQMIRNLLSNALKYTKRGKVLLGCRRHEGSLSIEIWDTGIGIPNEELQAIFEEYHQLDNAARERNRGLGLGLSIVKRLGTLLDHTVSVRSHPDKGSAFTIDIKLPPSKSALPQELPQSDLDDGMVKDTAHAGVILVIEDDPEVRGLLDLLLKGEGYRVITAPDGLTALDLVRRGPVRPELILSDYNLPNGMNGLQLSVQLRDVLHYSLPIIILTGDISTDTLRNIGLQHCVPLYKPVKVAELTQTIQRLLLTLPAAEPVPTPHPGVTSDDLGAGVIYVVDDDSHIRAALRSVLEDDGRTVEDYSSCEAFLAAYRPGREACLLIDAYLPGMNGLELLQRLNDSGHGLPSIMITGDSDVPMAVKAMKAGALDFVEKPVSRSDLLACVERALEQSRDAGKLHLWRETAANHVSSLTPRQRQIMDMVLAGHPSKNIAADLGISQRTVENHRASIMKKTGSKSLPALARIALAAAWDSTEESRV